MLEDIIGGFKRELSFLSTYNRKFPLSKQFNNYKYELVKNIIWPGLKSDVEMHCYEPKRIST